MVIIRVYPRLSMVLAVVLHSTLATTNGERWSYQAGYPSSVDNQITAGDPFRVIGRQEHARAANVSRLAKSGQRRFLTTQFDVLRCQIVLNGGLDEPRADGVGGNAMLTQLHGQIARQIDHRCLRTGIGGATATG